MYFHDCGAYRLLDMNTAKVAVYTIGHSNHSWQRFLELIGQHRIGLVVDVRSMPRSRFAPWSNLRVMERDLPPLGVAYKWMGASLGGIPRNPQRRSDTSRISIAEWYERRSGADDFLDAIEEVSRLAAGKRVTIMCSEGEPSNCHRTLLITPALERKGCEVRHILPK